MAKILFWPDMYKERGHWLPITTLAKNLDSAHDVAFMGIKDCESIATSHGFTFYPIFEELYPAGYSLENNLEPRLIIQEVSKIGDEERDKFLTRISGQPIPSRVTELIAGRNIPVYCVSNHNDSFCQELLEKMLLMCSF